MNPQERVAYFRRFWPAACRVNGWNLNDEARRKQVVLDCMVAVQGPAVTTSSPAFSHDEVTALFCYLEFLAHPADLDRSAAWLNCQEDYHAYNRAKQADWHEAATYGPQGSKRLQRDRFSGQRSAVGAPLDEFNPEAIYKRHLTTAKRHEAKLAADRKPKAPREITPELPFEAPDRKQFSGTAAPFA